MKAWILSSSVLILIVVFLRKLLKTRISVRIQYAFWLPVLLRLLIPVSVGSSPVSVQNVIPERTIIRSERKEIRQPSGEFVYQKTENEETGDPILEPPVTESLPSGKVIQNKDVLLAVWLAVAVGFLLTVTGSHMYFLHRLRISRKQQNISSSLPVFTVSWIRTPFLAGIFRPAIYLPDDLAEQPERLRHVLVHEESHCRHGDHIWSWLRITALALHWYNPLVWIAAVLSKHDAELACDETSLRILGDQERKPYGETLLALTSPQFSYLLSMSTAMTESKRSLRERIRYVVRKPKTARGVLAIVLVFSLFAVVATFTGSAETNTDQGLPSDIVRVSNVDELLDAIAPNTVIELSAGLFDLSTASNYGEDTHSSYYSWNGVYDGYELVLHNVENLTLCGAGKGKSTIATVPRSANVTRFISCQNLTVSNLTAGHTTEPGICSGGVISLEACTDVLIDDCGLYGCGTIGVQTQNSSNLTITGSEIYECSYSALDCDFSRDVRIDDCDIHNHGMRENQGDALSLFNISKSEAVTIYNCRIHDNRAQYLLNSSLTKNVLFLSNEILSNAFGAKVFSFRQYGATVDGCRFEGNDVSHGWYTGSGIYAADIEGNALDEGAELAEMTLRDIPPESVTHKPAVLAQTIEVPAGGQILVQTVDEFLSAIGPDRTIILDGELFDLSIASNYGGIGTEYYYWSESKDGPELVIHDVDGLTIHPKDTYPGAATIAAVPRFANVVNFSNCSYLRLVNLTLGHTKEPGACSGGVVNLQNCQAVTIGGCRLYGCGVLGLRAVQCSIISVTDTEIYECSQGAASFSQTDGIGFLRCNIHDVPSPALTFFKCSDITWNSTQVPDEGRMYDVNADGLLAAYAYTDESTGYAVVLPDTEVSEHVSAFHSEDGTVSVQIGLTSVELFSRSTLPVIDLEYHTITSQERDKIITALFGKEISVYKDVEGTAEDWAWGAVGTKEFYDRWIEDAKWAQTSSELKRILGNADFYDDVLNQISEFLEKYDHTKKYEEAPDNADLQPLSWEDGTQNALIESNDVWYRVGISVDPTPGNGRYNMAVIAAETDANGLYSVVLHRDYCSEEITQVQLDAATAKIASYLEPMGLSDWKIQSTGIMDHSTGTVKQLTILVVLEHQHVSDLKRCDSVYQIINEDDSICFELSADGRLFRMDYTCPLDEAGRSEEQMCSEKDLLNAIENHLSGSVATEYASAVFPGEIETVATVDLSITDVETGIAYTGNSYFNHNPEQEPKMIPAVAIYGTVSFKNQEGNILSVYHDENRPLFILSALDGSMLQDFKAF